MSNIAVDITTTWNASGDTLSQTFAGSADTTLRSNVTVPAGTVLQTIPLAVTKSLVQQFFWSSTQAITLYFNGEKEVQTVTITGSPTGGTFTLTYSGQTTAGIAYNATASAVQSALEALSNIAVGDVVVSGSAGGPYTVTFTGTLGLTNVATMTASGAGLTGGSTPSVGIAVVTEGAAADASWSLAANDPQVWRTPGIFANPMPGNLTKLHVTNAGTSSARVQVRFGVNNS